MVDDLITVWSLNGRVVARGIGHSSWVTGVAFDAWRYCAHPLKTRLCRCTDRSYRIVWLLLPLISTLREVWGKTASCVYGT